MHPTTINTEQNIRISDRVIPPSLDESYTLGMSENENRPDQEKDDWGFNYWQTATQAELKAWKEAAEKEKKFKRHCGSSRLQWDIVSNLGWPVDEELFVRNCCHVEIFIAADPGSGLWDL